GCRATLQEGEDGGLAILAVMGPLVLERPPRLQVGGRDARPAAIAGQDDGHGPPVMITLVRWTAPFYPRGGPGIEELRRGSAVDDRIQDVEHLADLLLVDVPQLEEDLPEEPLRLAVDLVPGLDRQRLVKLLGGDEALLERDLSEELVAILH